MWAYVLIGGGISFLFFRHLIKGLKNRRQREINFEKIKQVIQDRIDIISKLDEMNDDPALGDRDFIDFLPICEMADAQLEEAKELPECRFFPNIYNYPKLADVLKKMIED